MTDYQKCAHKAQQIIKKYVISEPFVDVIDIARKEGIDIIPVYFDDDHSAISGFLHKEQSKPVIYVNAHEEPRRQTFTIAHELGHYFLKHPANQWGINLRNAVYGSEEKSDAEKEADYFAACLLMPEEMVRNQMRKYHLTSKDYVILAEMFAVSNAAMRRRINQLMNVEHHAVN